MKTKRKDSNKKLFIRKETITILNQSHLKKLIGGYVPTSEETISYQGTHTHGPMTTA